MEPFKKILVDIDATVPAHPALERAVRLARSCGAQLTIVDVLSVPGEARRYLRADVEEDLVQRRRELLAQVARDVTGVATRSQLLTGRPATALIQEVLRSGHELLIRSHARDLVARGPKPYGAIDMELFRQCPCPVMVIGPGASVAQPRILGAVHSTENDVEQALNVRIIEHTLLMARLEQGSATLLEAWTPFAEQMVRTRFSEDAFSRYLDEARQRAADDLARLTGPFTDRLSPNQIVLRRGEPEDVIPEYVVAQGIDLVVMGTVARSGIAGLLIGNTAERVLRTLPCSVLAIKPEGFESPVRLNK